QFLYGNAGANYLDGGSGNDTLVGFGGDDSYVVDDASDFVAEFAGGGNDIVYVRGSFSLGASQEVETLAALSQAGTAPIVIVGNDFNQTLYGNAGANYLDGGSGNDTLVGFGGDDSYVVDDVNDFVAEFAGGGNDIVYVRGSFSLGSGQEVETLAALSQAGTAAIVIVGNGIDQRLYGNNGDNYLDGGGGTDVLQGFSGNDTYVVDGLSDYVVEGAGEGTDIVYARSSYTLVSGQEIEILSAINQASPNAMDLAGNEFANQIYGNAGANILDGGAGGDVLQGFGGADRFTFTTALGGGNVDQIGDFVAGTDKIQLSGAAGQPFAALASGTLAAGAFVIGTAAAQADDYIIYNSATGALLYDADGNGAGAAVQFATLGTGLSLTAADFDVSGPANNAPVVGSGATANVAENSPASTIVYQANASDADGDRITWSLSGADASLLTIDAVTGAVRLITSADFETKASYSFNVVASDSATSTPKAVTLTITDVADASTPIINETAAANNSTATAQAVDRGIFTVAPNGNLPDPTLPSATIAGNLPDSADKDFFAITLQAGEKLILDVDNTSGNLDAMIRVYDSNGVEIGSNDDPGSNDPGSAPHPTYGHNTDSFLSFRAPTAGTYYFSIESFQDAQNPTFGSYEINVSIGPPATPQQLIDEDVDALISGSSWDHLNLTYGFPTQPSDYPSNPDEVQNGFTPFTGTQQSATSLLVQLVANVTPLTFQLLSANPGQANLRYAMSNEPDVAYAYYPTNGGPSSLGGTAWFNHNSFNNPQQGNYAWMGILHETGHALGLKHGHEAPAVSPGRDSVEYTVMTYRSFPGQDLSDGGGYTNQTDSYPQTLMMYDIAALQKIYGANFNFSSGDSVYTWNPATGRMLINGATATSPTGNRVFLTIWDGGGNDTYDLSNYTASDTAGATTIDLRPGEWSTISQVQIANLGQGHFARGNIANALLYQGNTASLIENASGSQAVDTIIANQVANHLTGNGGADNFKWAASTDSAPGAAADTIMDFLSGTDHIDLSLIDANPATGGNDAFTFIGTSAFHNVAGEVRYDVTGGNAHIFADLDGNGVADMEIIVNSVATLTSSDFFL
ncbi:MAG TPA: DVUA0089 family protein, partial [Allosphingosinicella sp.]|nr:DVUA0089 family protein [Allosphingosinicella sp.]